MRIDLPAKARALTAALKGRAETRKALRGPADLRYAIADSIAALDETLWSATAVSGGFFMSARYLRMLEAVLPDNIQPHYALIFAGHGETLQPVAAMVMQSVDIALGQLRPEKDAKKRNVLDRLAGAATQRVLTCGNLLTYGQHGVALVDGVDARLAWHGVAEVLYRVREADKLRGKTHFVMIKDLHDPHTEAALHLTELSYRHVETEPNMVLALREEWKSYDDYLASLSSKYRANLRNGVLKPIEEAGCTVERISGLAGRQDRIFALYKSVHVNADVRPFTLQPAYFSALEAAAGDDFRCSVVKRDGEILGFLITVADGDTAIAYHIGFDREAGAALPIYLRLLHAGIADAIALRAKRVSYGRTALEPKAALGAKPQRFGVLLRHRQPVLNKLIKRMLLGVEHAEAPERNPFKQAKSEQTVQ